MHVSNIEAGTFSYMDVLREERSAREKIVPETVIYSGNVYDGGRYSPVDMTHKEDGPRGLF